MIGLIAPEACIKKLQAMSKNKETKVPYFIFSKAQLLNKYSIVTAAFLIWMLFFDKSSFPANYMLHRSVDRLEAAKSEYEIKIVEARAEKIEIEENKEKYARERYLMHKDNEDVIVIEKREK